LRTRQRIGCGCKRRVGGGVQDFGAIKLLKFAAS
jgi:predicted phage gp36 major capsid-like protein